MLGFSTWAPGAATKQLVHEVDELCYIVEGEGKLSVGGGARVVSARVRPCSSPRACRTAWSTTRTRTMSMVYVFSHPEYPPTREAAAPAGDGG